MIVNVLPSFTVTLAPVMSAPLAKLMLGVTAVLNSNPSGVFRTNVSLFTLLPKSCFFPSAIMIGPRVVHAGELPLAAVFAEIAPPPDAGVIMTAASPLADIKSAKTGPTRETFVFIK